MSTLSANGYLMKKLGNPKIRHCFREGNQFAHALAQQGTKEDVTKFDSLAT
ncbi:hypothetical protein RND71_019264 [Anisodus tanguticus]|uniref:Uncharacterized protein n=1 Tax=Anisodus tanguticus TaxID=243964 RepID=A0AAE1RZ51_9SOLA|nr:hypothetical protein RND71_019264 [Anisodus tanguticus]